MNYLLDSGPNPMFRFALSKVSNRKCLVLGIGGEIGLISKFSNDIVGINISREELRKIKRFNACLVLADAQSLPIKQSSVDFIVCKSTLHHLRNLDHSVHEMSRVIRKGSYVFLYEPGLLNPIAFFGRKFFPTEIHDPSEKPFNPISLRKVLMKNFKIINETDFFLFAHIVPILSKRSKNFRSPDLVRRISNIDAMLCKTFLKNFCWILIFILRKEY
jgi:ubiquinone/menaquinone biosynthesis C-methylase UbiE